jgi:catechol 2,3-dioxygenase-like lactoylglutathione lyase family enzyme
MEEPATVLHHIGVQTVDLGNCLGWYEEFLGARVVWSTDRFSELTRRRLPGVVRLTEVAVAGVRLHLFERAGAAGPVVDSPQFQHVCLVAGSLDELAGWRQRWWDVFASGRFRFYRPEPPSEIVTDVRGVACFYCFDVDGLELEFSYFPDGVW